MIAPAKVRVAVVGVGYFGRKHCGKLRQIPQAELAAVVDIDPEKARAAAAEFGCQWFTDLRQLRDIQAAVVAVPASRHFEVASALLEKGLDVLVEKPMSATAEQAQRLCQLAAEKKLVLQVGHLERFNPRWREFLRYASAPASLEIERRAPFDGRGGDVDAVREIMIHDLDILGQLTSSPVEEIKAVGQSIATPHIDRAEVDIAFSDGLKARLMVARGNFTPTRRARLRINGKVLELDLLSGCLSQKNGSGKVVEKVIEEGDPLLQQDRLFVEALCNGRKSPVPGSEGLRAVKLAALVLSHLNQDN